MDSVFTEATHDRHVFTSLQKYFIKNGISEHLDIHGDTTNEHEKIISQTS